MRLDVTVDSGQLAELHKRLGVGESFRLEDVQLVVDLAMTLAEMMALRLHDNCVRRDLAD